MDHLEVPNALAGTRASKTRLSPKKSIARPPATKVIIRGRAKRQIDVSQLLVRTNKRPRVCGASRFPRTLMPSLVTEVSLTGDGMEVPLLPASTNIEASHIAGWHLTCERIVMNFRSHHHDIATDNWWGRYAVQTPVDRTTQSLRQVNAPIPTKSRDRFARCAFKQIK